MARRTYGTGSVTPYAEGKWRLRWWAAGKQRSKVVVAPNRTQAEKLLRAELTDVDHGVAVDPNTMRVSDLLERWLADELAVSVKATTLQKYRQLVDAHVLPRVGTKRVQTLDKADVAAFRGELVRQCGACTAQGAFDRLCSALAWAVEMEWLRRNPCDGVKRPKYSADDAEAHPLTPAQLHAFLKLAATDTYDPLWRVFAWTGLRLGEGLGLRWVDLDLAAGKLAVRQQVVNLGTPVKPTIMDTPKTSKSRRTIGINDHVVEALDAHRTVQNQVRNQTKDWFDHGLVFCTRNGLPLSPNNVRRNGKALLAAVGVPKGTPHDLRHTHATHLLMAGVSLLEVSARLGHANVGITARTYAHWIQGSEERSIEAMTALMGDGLPKLEG